MSPHSPHLTDVAATLVVVPCLLWNENVCELHGDIADHGRHLVLALDVARWIRVRFRVRRLPSTGARCPLGGTGVRDASHLGYPMDLVGRTFGLARAHEILSGHRSVGRGHSVCGRVGGRARG